MKKLLLIVWTLAGALSGYCQGTIYVTNSLLADTLSVAYSPDCENISGAPESLTPGQDGAVPWSAGGCLYYQADSLGDPFFGSLPPSPGDWVASVNTSAELSYTPFVVPEPSAFSLFMIGFALTFSTGMLANAAKWVRNLIAGSNNE